MAQVRQSLYRQVIELNEQGVQCIQRGEFDAAIPFFGTGMRFLMESVAQRSEGDQDLQIDTRSRSRRYEQIIEVIPVSEEVYFPSPQDEVFGLFNRALSPRVNIDNLEENLGFYHHLFWVITAHNLALVHHLKGLMTGSSEMLARALDYYSLAYASAGSEQNVYLDEHPETMNLCLLALANNIGHIHFHHLRFEEVGICSDEIARRLPALVAASIASADNRTTANFYEEHRVFFLNACYFREAGLVSAPAA